MTDLSAPSPVQGYPLPNRSAFRAPESGMRDLSLPYLFRADYEEMSALIPGGLPKPPNKQAARAIASMSSALVTQAQVDATRYFSCSRSHDWWAAASRYVGTSYTYKSACWAMEALAEADVIGDLQIAPRGRPRPGEESYQSRFRPSDRLRGLALPRVRAEKGETIILKDAAGRLMPYKDNERIHRMRRFVEAFNEAEACWDIQLPAPGSVEEGYLLRFLPTDEGDAEFVVNRTLRSMFRVFNRGVFTKGGRFYGGWWQQVRSRDRAFILLEGSEVEELDIDHCHPELLYAKAGLRLDGDAYEMDGWTREQGKKAFNTLLNSSNEAEALHSIANELFGGETYPAAMLIRHVRRRHPKIDERGLFCSGAGLELMNADAEVCQDVMRDLAIKAKVPVLPVHDSFIVRRQDVGLLKEAMDRALAKQGVGVSSVGVSSSVSMSYRDIVLHTQEGREGGASPGGTGWDGSESGVSACVGAREGAVQPLTSPVEDSFWVSVLDELETGSPSVTGDSVVDGRDGVPCDGDTEGTDMALLERRPVRASMGGDRTVSVTGMGEDTTVSSPVVQTPSGTARTGISHPASQSPVDSMTVTGETGVPWEVLTPVPGPTSPTAGSGPQTAGTVPGGSSPIPVTEALPEPRGDVSTARPVRRMAPPAFVSGSHQTARSKDEWEMQRRIAARKAAGPAVTKGK